MGEFPCWMPAAELPVVVWRLFQPTIPGIKITVVPPPPAAPSSRLAPRAPALAVGGGIQETRNRRRSRRGAGRLQDVVSLQLRLVVVTSVTAGLLIV